MYVCIHVLGTYPNHGLMENVSAMIDLLQNKYNILSLFFTDLIRHQSSGIIV